ncbi:DUF2199 domain-containing protein [Streptomyces sp. NPDC000888]
MIANDAPACSCCGTPTLDEKRIDVRFGLPDVALAAGEEARHQVGVGALLRVDGVGCFMRCLLPVRLTDDIELVFGTWLEVSDAELDRAHTIWEDPAYADLTLRGALANSIKPWGDGLLGATATVEVRNPDEIPYVVTSDQHLLAHVLAGTWDKHDVLSCLGLRCPWPCARTWTSTGPSNVAGLAARVVEGTSQFAAPGRNVQADLFSGSAGDGPEEFLASLLVGAPTVPSEQQLTEQVPDGVRHAFCSPRARRATSGTSCTDSPSTTAALAPGSTARGMPRRTSHGPTTSGARCTEAQRTRPERPTEADTTSGTVAGWCTK